MSKNIARNYLGKVPRYRVRIAIPVTIETEDDVTGKLAIWELCEIFGSGNTASDAMEDLGRTIADDYDGLLERAEMLGDDLKFKLEVMRRHLQHR